MVSTTILPVSRSVSGASTTGSSFHTPLNLSSAGSSQVNLTLVEDEDNDTITRPLAKGDEEEQATKNFHLNAMSSLMTELGYTINDIHTRIFAIQELRHKTQSTTDSSGTTSSIDDSLMILEEKVDTVVQGMKTVNEFFEPLLQNSATPTIGSMKSQDDMNTTVMLRKHAELTSEWESVHQQTEVLREELKEDKWLTVFRTVTDQADGMMSSLEKAVMRCQDFIWQVHRTYGSQHRSSSSLRIQDLENQPPPTLEQFNPLFDSYEAKKKHYMPATSKVLSIIDKGVRDRVTKNGETLRRHAESAKRWRELRQKITNMDAEMEQARRILVNGESTPSEAGSSTSGFSMVNGYLATPPSGGKTRSPSSSGISGTISPFRKLANKFTSSASKVVPSTPPVKKITITRMPSSEPAPVLRRQKSTGFGSSLRASEPPTPNTPDRPLHKYSHSLTPDSSPQTSKILRAPTPSKGRPSLGNKQPWNSSTKVESEDRTGTVRGTPPRRPPSSFSNYGSTGSDLPPVPALGALQKRSVSRQSMASSRPFSPAMSSMSISSTNHSSTGNQNQGHFQSFRPPSRAQTPSRNYLPPVPVTPRARAKTPSHIPKPSQQLHLPTTPSARSISSGAADSPPTRRAFSPAFSTASGDITSAGFFHPPRPPSRSMIPVPSLSLSTPSRPSSAMSDYGNNGMIARAQTPSKQLSGTTGRLAGRLSMGFAKAPPSSFKDSQSPSSRAPSRSGSRAGAYTPLMDNLPLHEYVPSNPKDPLDVEVAEIVNSIVHGLLVERVDPPLRKIPKEGEEIKAQYAFSNALSRKVLTCRLTTLTRSNKNAGGGDATMKKVMVRVGGGWQDLGHYVMNRQAGM